MTEAMYNLGQVSLETSAAFMSLIIKAGFDEVSIKSFIAENRGNDNFDKPSLLRSLYLASEGLGHFKPINDPEIKVSYEKSSYGYSATSISPNQGFEFDKNIRILKLSSLGLASPFLEREKTLCLDEALRRIQKNHHLATPFEFRWFMEHMELIPQSWKPQGNDSTVIIFAGFPVLTHWNTGKIHYPGLTIKAHSGSSWEFGQRLVSDDNYVLIKGQAAFAIIENSDNLTKE